MTTRSQPDDISRLVAESAIRALISRAALLGDTGAPEDYASVYSQDAVWQAGARDVGLAAIIESARQRRLAGTSGPGTNSRHLVTTMEIAFDDGDAARATSYFVFIADTASAPRIAVTGVYIDRLARIDGDWRITERVMTTG
jgi:SnoaL-like domain